MGSTETKAVVEHLTAETLAVRLAIPKYAVYTLVRSGKLRALHIGRRVRFRLIDVEAFEEAGGCPVKPRRTVRNKKQAMKGGV
jgi:excisionase family DNA binding protein